MATTLTDNLLTDSHKSLNLDNTDFHHPTVRLDRGNVMSHLIQDPFMKEKLFPLDKKLVKQPNGNEKSELENYDRITTILSKFSGVTNVPAEILTKAAMRGTKVHNALEKWHKDNAEGINLGNTESDPEIALYIDSFAKWIPEKNVHTIERRFYCDDLKITGQIDLLSQNDDGTFTIYDYKTSASMHRSYEVQLSAYAYLARLAGFNVTKKAIIFLKKDGRMAEEFPVENDLFDVFLSCLQVYRFFGMFLE